MLARTSRDDVSEQAVEPERTKVYRWRYRELRKAGYSRYFADLLAEREDVDLHNAVAMLKAGCPPELAVLILA
jgi:hypothetical protein